MYDVACVAAPSPQVIDVSTSKTGKHGHAKCNFTALDIFTNKKYEDMCPSSHNCDVPNITRTEWTLVDISDDGFVSLMNDETGERPPTAREHPASLELGRNQRSRPRP